MVIKNYTKSLAIIFLLVAPTISLATVPSWQIVPNESSLTFTATQNNAPVNGDFKQFTGNINYDPDQLDNSNVEIIVDISSISNVANSSAETLKDKDWFNEAAFPKAVFKSSKFTKTGNNAYQADGSLTIRDKTLPVTLTFNQEEYTQTSIRISGKTVLQRTAFGIGQGEWSDTNSIADSVIVNFKVSAIKK